MSKITNNQILAAFWEAIFDFTFIEKMSFLWSLLFIFFLVTVSPKSKTWILPMIMKNSEAQ